MSTINDNKVLLGSFSFHFDTGNFVEYSICAVPAIIGDDGFQLERRWITDGKKETSNLGCYASVEAAARFALEAWNCYILKDELPTMQVTGSLDAEDLRNMMLDIQEEFETPEDDEPDPEPTPVAIDPLDYAIRTIAECTTGLKTAMVTHGLNAAVMNELIALEDALSFLNVLLVEAQEEI